MKKVCLFIMCVLGMNLTGAAELDLFRDSFDRSVGQENDIDASSTGMKGLAAPLVYVERGDNDLASNAGLTNIEDNTLHMADGTNMTTMYLDHNFTEAEILTAGGMKIGLTILSNDGNEDDQQRFVGFGVGNTFAECANSQFDFNGVGYRGREGNHAGTADMWIGWSPNNGGEIQVFKNGPSTHGGENYDLDGIPLGSQGRLELELLFHDFNAGTTVYANILWNSVVVHSTTFQWDNTGANYIGINGRQNNQGYTVDDFSVVALTSEEIPVLTDFTVTPARISDSSTEQITLTWSAAMVSTEDTYAVTADKAVVFPNGDETGAAVNGPTSITTEVDGTLGGVEFTVTLFHDSQAVSSRTATVSAVGPTLLDFTVSPETVDDNAVTPVTLTWEAEMVTEGITYAVTADKMVEYPGGNNTGPATDGQTSITAHIDGMLGDVAFSITLMDGDQPVDSSSTLVDVISIPDPDAPNVIVILLDDTGWSDIGCYGSEIQTPNIDMLAEGGVRFRDFYQAARCAPTRIALISGLYTQQGATNPGASLPPLRTDNNVTMAEVLGAAGYRTYMAGKWHLGKKAQGRDPLSRGFMHVFGQGSNVDGANTGNAFGYWLEGNYHIVSTNNEIPRRQYGSQGLQFHYSDAVGDYSVDFINHHLSKDDGRPFFLYMPFNAAHWPVCAPAELANKYTDIGDPNPEDEDVCLYEEGWDIIRAAKYQRQLAMGVIDSRFTLSPKGDHPSPVTPIPDWDTLDLTRRMDLARRQAVYAAMLDQVDINIGKVLAKLSQEGMLDNTLIFFCCDNGANYEGGLFGNTSSTTGLVWDPDHLDSMGQPQNAENSGYPRVNQGGGWANMSNTPFRLFKHFTHDGGIRTSAILHWPAAMDPCVAGTWTDERGHLIDVMATVVDATGANYPLKFNGHSVLPMEGTSLLPVLQGQSLPGRDIGVEHERNRAFFRGNYKFTTKNFSFSDGSSPAHELELYNMADDPTETNNLAGTMPDKLTEMIDGWNAWATRVGVPGDRLVTAPPADPCLPDPDYPHAYIQDTFERNSNTDIDAETTGMSGSLAPITYMESFEGSGAGSIQVLYERLQMATGTGMGTMYLSHNFTDASILESGGLTVMLDVLEISGGDNPENRFGGFGIGLTESEAASAGDIFEDGTTLRAAVGGGGAAAVSDFYIDYAMDGMLRAWSGNTLLSVMNIGTTYCRIRVDFLLPDFNAGTTVIARISGNDELQDTVAFSWDYTGENFIGLSARALSYVKMDNLVVTPYTPTLPESMDLTDDGQVMMDDFAVLGGQWLSGYSIPCPSADLTGNCFVDLNDLKALASKWLQGNTN